ncbi:MAG: glycogen/starch/alpha-glucan phosphorylase [bacterium]|nr:glycogen/starch/alpha-glucan phosphorylase [bacterium]
MDRQDIHKIRDFEILCANILHHTIGKSREDATEYDKYKIFSVSLRDKLLDKWLTTLKKYKRENSKRVYYLSLEFLIGRSLQNTALNLNMEYIAYHLLKTLGMDLEELYEMEYDAGLGNGGLGRLAACFLDSMATMDIPGFGFGIRYEYGMFNQSIENGYQVEYPDNWLYRGNPWSIKRTDKMCRIKFYGRTRPHINNSGKYCVEWIDTDDILAVPYDLHIPGYRNKTVNILTLWSAQSTDEFNLKYFNNGDYIKAVEEKSEDETISKVLYPEDDFIAGRELRLKQQYFFVSASLQCIIKCFFENNDSFDQFPDKVAIQLNDTHPTIAIPELMRIMIDDYQLKWETAWDIVTRTFAFTNHTLMPEALEKWNVSLMGNLLPRLMEIIFEINSRFLDIIRKTYPGNEQKLKNMSIIEEGDAKKVRMAYLGIVGSHSINGVAKLHSQLLKDELFSDFFKLWPEKFNNKTNGITQRRWLKQANRLLSGLISDTIGPAWVRDLSDLKKLEKYADNKDFHRAWKFVKSKNKINFVRFLKSEFGFDVDPNTMFDVQVKRIHEYKRQLLNVLNVINRYLELKESSDKSSFVPRTVMIGGKAAPGYDMAKLIIKLINDVGNVINNDTETSKYLKLLFIPNYRVSLAEKIFPASDLSEQISTAGTEASGTGNMKFALNGALTIGTLDGANIEIKDEVGDDNIFIFGLNSDEVEDLNAKGYNPYDYFNSNEKLRNVINLIESGYFSQDEPGRFKPIIKSLLEDGDKYMLLADFEEYIECQKLVDENYLDQDNWTRKSILNVANMGYFSSDRTIKEYAEEIWGLDLKKKK